LGKECDIDFLKEKFYYRDKFVKQLKIEHTTEKFDYGFIESSSFINYKVSPLQITYFSIT